MVWYDRDISPIAISLLTQAYKPSSFPQPSNSECGETIASDPVRIESVVGNVPVLECVEILGTNC